MAKTKLNISEDKAKRIAVGATVGGLLIVLFLVIVLIVQFVQIGVRQSESARLDDEIARYEEMIESDQTDLDYYQTQTGLYYLARKEGWK